MKILALGDTHGRNTWKKIIKKEKQFDKLVFIGDYVDSFDITEIEQLQNLNEIVEYKKNNTEKVILLVGNHDYQYMDNGLFDERYSGFQPDMYPTFKEVFEDNKKLFQMCYENSGIVFTHAGLTKTFVDQKIGSYSEKSINDVFYYKPHSFKFYEFDRSGCGEDINQSCIWVRPTCLDKDAIKATQVIGHTQINKIDLGKSVRRNYYMIDCLQYGEYLIIEDGIFKVGKV